MDSKHDLPAQDRGPFQLAFAAIRKEARELEPSPAVELHLLRVLASRRASDASGRLWPWIAPVALTAALAIALLPRLSPVRMGAPPLGLAAPEAALIAIPYVVPPAPYERTTMVRTRIPLQVLIVAGFATGGEDPQAGLPAVVLYGEDGRMLAVRVLHGDLSTKERN